MTTIRAGRKEYLSAQFNHLEMPGTTVAESEFDGCTATGCNFSEVELRACRFRDCRFSQCNFSMASIVGCRFVDVSFEDCKLTGMDWTRAAWSTIALPAPVAFIRCILDDSSFFGLSLAELVAEACRAHDVDFRESDLEAARFCGTDLTTSLFSRTNLKRADFTGAMNYRLSVLDNDVRGARFDSDEAIGLLEGLGIELN